MAKKKKSAIPTIPGLSSDSKQFSDELQKQPDHIAAMLAAQYLSDILESLLRAFFVDHSDVANKLFSDNGALDSLASRIYATYALGLIGPELHEDLHTIRKIRNSFAHTYWRSDFSHTEMSKKCRNLKTSRKFWEVRIKMFPNSEAWRERDHFMVSSIMIANQLMIIGLSQKHRDIGKDIVFADLPSPA